MPKFNIDSAGDNKPRIEQRWVWLNQIEPDEFNGEIYSIAGVEALADDIKLNGLLQFPLVRYMPGGKYMIISGHRRVAAIRLLAKEDPEQWKMIPVILDPDKDDTSAHIKLISANAVNRELSQGEIMKQTLKMYSLLTEQKKKENLPGRVRDMVAKKLNMSAGAVGEYMTIEQNLIFYLKQDFLKGELSKAVTVELSKLTTADQMNWLDRIRAGEKVTADVVRHFRQQLEAKAPDKAPNVPDKAPNVPDKAPDIPDKAPDVPDKAYNVPDNVSEPDTQAEVMDNPPSVKTEKEMKLQRIMEKVKASGWDSLEPCERCFSATLCEKCCATCTEPCNAQQPCRKKDVKLDTEAQKEDVSEPDTQEVQNKERDLEWNKDIMRRAVVDIAASCAAIRKYSSSGTDCDYCPLHSRNSCTLTDAAPKSATYMFEARRTDDELNKLFEEV